MKTGKHQFFLVTILLLVLIYGCSEGEKSNSKHYNEHKPKPNIVLIFADDLGYAEVGCYGQEKIMTPNIDELAEQGIKFTDFYAGSPECAPSRCVLMTGLHTGHSYIRKNDEMGADSVNWDFRNVVKDPSLEGQRPLPANSVTLGTLLQNAGYTTGGFGKWCLGGPLTVGHPNKQGFDQFFGNICQRQGHNYYNLHLWDNDKQVLLDNDHIELFKKLDEGVDPMDPASYEKWSGRDYSPKRFLDKSLEFIEDNKDKPFFLYFPTILPHVPLQVPEEYLEKYKGKFEEEPYLGEQGYMPSPYPRATYAAMVTYLDDQIGAIIQKLKDEGVYDNTIIIFTSDNGPTFNGGSDSPFFDSAKPFKSEYGWGKCFVREGGIRVPMIVSWPGVVEPGQQTDHLGASWDLLPTLCEVADIDIPENLDGISFLPLLTEGKQKNKHGFLYWEFAGLYQGDEQQAVRMGKWKAVRGPGKDFELELYDLENDIQEQNNVASEFPDVVKKIMAIMNREHVPSEIETFRLKQLGE